ncbi:hypothetical protein [Streptomyces aurantiogriseus]|uniref:Uncharacterized protein n=1 Tax=Streptomyces aurantiogriseus TaxID=66870 RepID=A0A918FF68_9ACTN|nr:hypothetical protein [Streptomyces aurantiogriseus]GGR33221.1 hypothetical protein GCM10010251_56810 [Streptomyces aurantiogriseus]
MHVEQVVDELYALPPAEFTAARDARVAEARRAKDTAAARTIAGLRRPTLAAWVSNLFVRERPKEVEKLLALGETLREAHRTLDAARLREAGSRQHKVIDALAREAAGLARQAGHPVSEAVRHEVEQIFHAALGSPDIAAQWSAGRLEKAPQAAVGFDSITPDVLPERRTAPAGETPADLSEKPPSEKRPSAADRERRQRLRRARSEADETAAEARRRDEELRTAEEAHQAAVARASDADERVAQVEERLHRARQEQRDARAAAGEAETAVKAADRAARDARRAADRAARALSRLPDPSDGST